MRPRTRCSTAPPARPVRPSSAPGRGGTRAALALLCLAVAAPAAAEWGTPVIPDRTAEVLPAHLYVVGIDRYAHVQPLQTSVGDARAIRDLLIEKFQFVDDEAHLLERYDGEATRAQIFQDLQHFRELLTEDDSLLIYFAGHGKWGEGLQRGYWIPVDGQPGQEHTWISNSDIRDALKAIPAKHVWLISDSCFSGTLLGQKSAGDQIDDYYYADRFGKKSRQVLTSGGDEPVADRGCDGHSVFGCYLLDFLRGTDRPYLAPMEVFTAVAPNVTNNSQQTPAFGPMRDADDRGGAFVLVNRAPASSIELRPPVAPGPDGSPVVTPAPLPPGGAGPAPGVPPRHVVVELPADSALVEAGYELVRIPVGSFQMGSDPGEDGRTDDERAHAVTLTRSIAVGRTEVTQALWESVMGGNPARFEEPGGPVESVSWWDAVRFCNALSEREGLTPAYTIEGQRVRWDRDADGYRLPTEAEWEYAARGAQGGPFAGGTDVDAVAWYQPNAAMRPQPVAQLRPNAFGLHDLSGNLWEWVYDGKRTFTDAPRTDPLGPTSDRQRVLKGGSWAVDAHGVRIANRHTEVPDYSSPQVGFRVVRWAP